MKNMVKNAVKVALFASAAAVASVASAEGISGQYVNAQIAISEIGNIACNNVSCTGLGGTAYDFGNGVSFVGTYGMSIPAVHQYFGIEAEVSKSIKDPEYNSWSWGWGGTHAEFDYYTAAAYAVATIPVLEKLNVRARAGLAYSHTTITTNQCVGVMTIFGWYTPASCEYSDSTVSPSVSGGVSYDFNPNVNFMAELTAWDVDQGNFHLSAGAQIKF